MTRPRIVWLSILAAGLALAFLARFIQDDAFIAFRYAENLANGRGLVFNVGERVEGYSDFLWTVLMAIPHRLGSDPVAFAYAVGLACFLGTLVVTRRLTRTVSGLERDALLAPALLATNYTFLCYATGGLETQLQALLVTSVAWLGLEPSSANSARRAVLLSLVTGLAVLTRLDSLLLMFPIWLAVLIRVFRAGRSGERVKLAWLAAAILPGAVLVGTWMAWKLAYYGSLFPNTVLVKGPEPRAFEMGARYLYQLVRSYWLAPVLLLVALQAGIALKNAAYRTLLVVLVLWSAYIVVVGGDFMEFRMIVPALPLLFVVVVTSLPADTRLRIALAGTLVLGSVSHMLSFAGAGGVEHIRNLAAHVSADGDDWRGAGRTLGRLFRGSDPPVVLATTAVGAIPYYSGLPTVDMLGLTDSWVARHGNRTGARPGHRRIAPLSYLLKRGCHLVLGHPYVLPAIPSPCDDAATSKPASYGLRAATPSEIPRAARVVLVPLADGRKLRALYLTPHARIEGAIETGAIETCPTRFDAAVPSQRGSAIGEHTSGIDP